MDTPVHFFFTGVNTNWSASGNNYNNPVSGGQRNSTANSYRTPITAAGTLSNLNLKAATDPSPGNWTFTLYINNVASALTCVMSAGTTTASDITHTVSVVEGDTIELRGQGAATPVLPTIIEGFYVFSSTASNKSPVMGGTNSGLTNSATRYGSIQGSTSPNTTADLQSVVMPTGGTFSKLYVNLAAAPGTAASGKSYTFSLYKNGIIQLLTCTILDTATSGSDLVNSVSYAAGDLITLEILPANTPTSVQASWGALFSPTTDGESLQMSFISTYAGSATPKYSNVAGSGNNNTEASVTNLTYTYTAKNLYINLSTAPGAAQTNTVTLRKASADTALTAVISGAAQTTNNDTTHTVSYTSGDFVDLKAVCTAAPASTRYSASFVSYIAPAVTGTNSNMMMLGVG